MELPASAKLLLICADLLALAAVMIGCVFLKTSAPRSATGVIRSKTGIGGGTYQQQQVGVDRGFRAATQIPIAPSYSFQVELDGGGGMAVCSLNVDAAKEFGVGQKVKVDYIVRGMKPIWSRIFITHMERVR